MDSNPDGKKNKIQSKQVKSGSRETKLDAAIRRRARSVRQVGTYGTIPMVMLAGPAIGYFIGNFLDESFNTDPYLTLVFIILGFVAAVKNIMEMLSRGKNGK